MNVKDAIKERRAFRSLIPVDITKDLINDLAECAQITASCFNNQPWRFIFVYDPYMLIKMRDVFSHGNKWANKASMIIVVIGNQDDDCVIYDRIYFRFDIGMATEAMILRATELGLVAHPIAGYSQRKTKKILGIPEKYSVITLVLVGKHSNKIDPVLSNKQVEAEKKRPERIKTDNFVYINRYIEKVRKQNEY
jgi:nitroreductase